MGSTLDFFSDPRIQGLLTLLAILQLLFATLKNLPVTIKTIRSSWNGIKSATKQPLSTIQLTFAVLQERLSAITILRVLGYFLLGWFFYCLPWILLSVAFQWQFESIFRMIVSSNFILLSASVLLGGLATKPWQNIGHFLGGAISLGALAVYFTYINPALLETVSRQTWFIISGMIGGMFGLFAGTLTIHTVNLFNKLTSAGKQPEQATEQETEVAGQ